MKLIAVVLIGVLVAGCQKDSYGPEPHIDPPPGANISFKSNIRPIFEKYGCVNCHGGSGGLFVGTVAQLLQGGDNGPAIVSGKSGESLIMKKTSVNPPFGSRMPLGGAQMADADRNIVGGWIDQGAKDN